MRLFNLRITREGIYMSSKTVYLSGTEIVLTSPFIREEVNALKKTVPQAKWDRIHEVWRIPLIHRDAVIEYARLWDYEVESVVEKITLPKNVVPVSAVTLDDKGVVVSFPYDAVKEGELKKIPGFKWDSQTYKWHGPASALPAVLGFAERFDIDVSDLARDEARRVSAAASLSVKSSAAVESSLRVDGLGLELYPYQAAGVEYIVEKRKVFVADEMGLGKTLQAIASIEFDGAYPALVVVPPSLTLDWELKIKEAVPHRDVLRLEGRGEFVEGAADGADFVVVGNANIVHHQAGLTGVKFRSVVFDESQAFKNSKAQRTKAAKAIARSVRKDGLKLCLSGTPLENRVSEFGPQLDLLDQLKQFGGLWRFYQEYAGAFKDRFGHWRLDGDVSASKLTELNQRLRETCYLRREKSQVLADLPELDHQVVYLDWDPAIRQEYVDAERDIIEYFAAEKARIAEELGESATAAKIRARMAAQSNEHLIKLGVLKKICAKNKLKMLKPVVENYHEAGHKVIVAAHHRDIVTQTATKLQAPKIIGGQKVEDTEEAKKLFQENPKVQSIVLSTQAAKTGHTLTAATQVLLLEQPWTPSDYDQMVARAHRNGQTHPVTATTLIVPETIDEHIHKMLAKKRTKITAAMTGQTEKQDTAALEELFGHYL